MIQSFKSNYWNDQVSVFSWISYSTTISTIVSWFLSGYYKYILFRNANENLGIFRRISRKKPWFGLRGRWRLYILWEIQVCFPFFFYSCRSRSIKPKILTIIGLVLNKFSKSSCSIFECSNKECPSKWKREKDGQYKLTAKQTHPPETKDVRDRRLFS